MCLVCGAHWDDVPLVAFVWLTIWRGYVDWLSLFYVSTRAIQEAVRVARLSSIERELARSKDSVRVVEDESNAVTSALHNALASKEALITTLRQECSDATGKVQLLEMRLADATRELDAVKEEAAAGRASLDKVTLSFSHKATSLSMRGWY